MPEALRFSVAACTWQEGLSQAELPELAPLLRRRASHADRLALRAAIDCVPKELKLPSVFASRHGELARSVELLEGMARGEGHLPMSFSLSVHNSAAGLWSIAREDRSNSVSLAAGENILSQGLLEALSLLPESEAGVLLLAFDDPMPEPLAFYRESPEEAFALGLHLQRGEDYRLEATDSKEALALPRIQAARALRDFFRGTASAMTLEHWKLQRRA